MDAGVELEGRLLVPPTDVALDLPEIDEVVRRAAVAAVGREQPHAQIGPVLDGCVVRLEAERNDAVRHMEVRASPQRSIVEVGRL